MDALSAFSEAFSAFRKNMAGCVLYTLAFGFGCAVSFTVLAAIAFVFGILSVGSVVGVVASGAFSATAVLLGGALLVLFLGVLIVSWLFSGLTGSYYDTMQSFLSGRKPTIMGFFGGIPGQATPLFLAQVVQGLIIGVPAAIIGAAASMAGFGSGLPALAVAGATQLYSGLIGFFTTFLVAAVVVDRKGSIGAVQASFSRVARNIVPTVIYLVVAAAVCLPIIFAVGVPLAILALAPQLSPTIPQALLGLGILFSLAYALFFAIPFLALANLALYRKLR